MFCNDCQHQYHGEHICEPDVLPYRQMEVKPKLSPSMVHELERVLWKAHTTPKSLGADIPNMARAVMEFFGFEQG